MGAYNAVYGKPACASRCCSPTCCGNSGVSPAMSYPIAERSATSRPTQIRRHTRRGRRVAVKAGCDLCSGMDYDALLRAVKQGLISEKEIDTAVGRVLEARFRLGLFDPPDMVPYARIPISQNDTPAHEALALQMARESIVLLKNDGVLPLDRAKIKRIAVIGANANSVPMLLGNYNGTPSQPVTILDGIKKPPAPTSRWSMNRLPAGPADRTDRDGPMRKVTRAIAAARTADIIIYVGGISPQLESEEKKVDYEGFSGRPHANRTAAGANRIAQGVARRGQAGRVRRLQRQRHRDAVGSRTSARDLTGLVSRPTRRTRRGRSFVGDANPAGRMPVTCYRSTADFRRLRIIPCPTVWI